MRSLLLTGKGGVGKTTMAAATGVHAARRGLKTLVVSTDPAHSLADAFAVPLRAVPTEVEPGLYAQQIDTQSAFEQGWREISGWLKSLLEQSGVDPFEAEELTVLPGAEELLALLELRNQVRDGRFDVIVVDCAPTGETLRLLALPDALSWWMRRIFPPDRRVARALRPVMANLIGVPAPPDAVFAAAERLCAELADVRELLTDATTSSIRLVVTPEALVLAEARRAATSLSLYGYRVDGVIANRIFPGPGAAQGGTADWVSGWAASQQAQLQQIAASFPGLPLWLADYAGAEPIGAAAMAALADSTYDAAADPLAVVQTPEPLAVERVARDEFVLALALPHADPGHVDLARKGDDLLITVNGWRRVLALPPVLCRCAVDGAGLVDGRLRVRFRADPDIWMRS
jgi:arsenite/tail-anchored protein-transporting ATPase